MPPVDFDNVSTKIPSPFKKASDLGSADIPLDRMTSEEVKAQRKKIEDHIIGKLTLTVTSEKVEPEESVENE